MSGTTWADRARFLAKSFVSLRRNAALMPSSDAAVDAMLSGIDFAKVRMVLELGAGTGPYTSGLVARCMPEASIVVLEIDASYRTLLKAKFGDRIVVEPDGAEDLEQVLARLGIETPDLVVSSVPFLAGPARTAFHDAIRRLTWKGSVFRCEIILLPWGLWVYRDLPIRFRALVWWNLPPMWIYGIN